MRHIGILASAGKNIVSVSPPTITIDTTTNYNQNIATFNATVNPNGATTSVKFQYSTNGSSWTDGSTNTGITGSSQSTYSNQTGLAENTLYYVRAVATNSAGTSTSSSTTFTTWHLITYLKSTYGPYSVSVPSVTPTGGSAIAPTIYEMLIYGGGGGATQNGGGGGGGYRIASSKQSSTTGTQNITGTVGSNGGGGADAAYDGGNTTLVIGSTTYTAGGGKKGGPWNGGQAGTGDNTAYAGGTGNNGYTYISGYNQIIVGYNTYCCATDKFGNCTSYCTDYNSPIYGNDYNSPIYSTDYSRYAGGGGGGTDSLGANATYPDGGGAGGTGGGAYGLRGGNGGGGYGTASIGSTGSTSGSGPIVGTGGTYPNAANGLDGGVTFKYYGP